MQVSHYLPQHSSILNHRYRYGCSTTAEIFHNKHSHITSAWSSFLVLGRSAQAQLRHGMALIRRTQQGLLYMCRCKLLPAWQQAAAHHLILRKSENAKAEKNAFPALLLLLNNCVCHGGMASKSPTVGRAGTISPRHLAVVVPHSTARQTETVTAKCIYHPVWCFPSALFLLSKSLPTLSCVWEPLEVRSGLLSARQSFQPTPKHSCSRTLRRQLQTGWMVTPTPKYILNNF